MTVTRKPRTYAGARIAVEYDLARCIHAAECVRGAPAVFDPARRPWIDPDAAPAETVAEVVRRCPTGALRARSEPHVPEAAPTPNRVRVVADGPLYAEGALEVRLPGQEDAAREHRVALCRCGASSHKPYCDNSHVAAGFRDPATGLGDRLAPATDGASAPHVEVTFAPGGPILLKGPVAVDGADGGRVDGGGGALCRCGASATKPYCDGSHVGAGFEAD